MERRCSSGSIGEHLTAATRTDAGASKSDLRLRSARVPFNTPASMIAGILLVDDRSFLYLSSTTPLPGLNGPSFRMQLFQNIPFTTNRNISRFMILFLYFFLILLFGHLGDQCAFALVVVVSLRLCTSFSPHDSVRIPPFRCSRAGPGDMAICCPVYASTLMLDALMRLRRSRSSVLSTVIVATDNRRLQTTWTLPVLSEIGGE